MGMIKLLEISSFLSLLGLLTRKCSSSCASYTGADPGILEGGGGVPPPHLNAEGAGNFFAPKVRKNENPSAK